MSAVKKMWEKALPYALMLLGAAYVWHDFNGDLWFMLGGGRYIVGNGFPYTEPFTLHENLDFVMQQWLTNLLFWELFDNFGAAGLFALESILSVVIILLYARLCMIVTNGNKTASFMAAGLFGLCMAFSAFVVRPQMFSYICLLAEVIWLAGGGRLFAPFVISVLFINFHAAMWPLMFVMLLPFAVAALDVPFLGKYFVFGNVAQSGRRLAAVAALILAGGFVNPYGLDAVLYGVLSYGDPVLHRTVFEMTPLDITQSFAYFLYAGTFAAIFCAGRERVPVEYFLLTLGTAYMAMNAQRNFPVFLLFGWLTIVYFFRNVGLPENLDKKKAVRLGTAIFFLLFAISFSDRRIYMDKGHCDEQAADFLLAQEKPENIRMYVGYSGSGSYLEFRGIKCYMDTRAEIFLKANNHRENILYEYYDLQFGHLDYREFFAAHDFTHAYVNETSPIVYRALAGDPAFTLLFEGESPFGSRTVKSRLYKVDNEAIRHSAAEVRNEKERKAK